MFCQIENTIKSKSVQEYVGENEPYRITNTFFFFFLGGHMTTLKGEEIDYSGTPLNKGGLVATIGENHKSILEKLPNWDPEKH